MSENPLRKIIDEATILQFNATIIVGVLVFLTFSSGFFEFSSSGRNSSNATGERDSNGGAATEDDVDNERRVRIVSTFGIVFPFGISSFIMLVSCYKERLDEQTRKDRVSWAILWTCIGIGYLIFIALGYIFISLFTLSGEGQTTREWDADISMTPDPILEWMKVIVPLIAALAAFGLGVWSSRLHEGWKMNKTKPVIVIQDNVLPVETEIEVKGNPIDFVANRLIVINKVRSGAKDCKAYIRFEESKQINRTGWMLPDDNTALTVTLNVNMPEYVDLCAISKDGIHFAITNERGFKGKPEITSTP